MTVYTVGDSIEEINPRTGEVTYTGVVTGIDDRFVYARFANVFGRDYFFSICDKNYRLAAKPPVPEPSEQPHEELAIIRDIHVGMRDCSKPVLYFTVDLLFGSALQIIEDIPAFIRETGCYKLEDLEGKPCIVERSNLNVRYSRIKK